ncbi:hypothetical protein EMPS_09789 [Entomortierella parvispora]|uniref:SET domain-containing protein n=1 Tax=Entomortierella parvispora TaxID=205924 RepID=A0A9P3HIP8_9FUNG|nr:hypothetical protein EMPS_09789 [Entomortierella parvispora]
MATKAKHSHTHPHNHGPAHDRNHAHSKMALKSKPAKKIDDFLDSPVLACFARNSLPFIMTVPDSDFSTVQEHFVPSADLQAATARADVAKAPGSEIISNAVDHNASATTLQRVRLDRRFKIGYSKLTGHSIELRRDISHETRAATEAGGKVESGTRLFEKDELPYASLVEDVWRGKLCDECLRVLPEDKSLWKSCLECPAPTPASVTASPKSRSLSLVDDEEIYKGSLERHDGPVLFCSESCQREAWAAWHQFECRFGNELKQLGKQTRLALRIFWKNRRHNIRMTGNNATANPVTSPPSSTSKPTLSSLIPKSSSMSSSASLVSSSGSKIAKLTKAAAGLTLDSEVARISSSDSDGSGLTPAQLCHNFHKINQIMRMSYIMTGYYLQHLLGLTQADSHPGLEDLNGVDVAWSSIPVVTMELAYLQALVQFNSFSIKNDVTEPALGSDMMMRVNHYVIGSGVYLLASLLNHSCAPSAMTVFGNNTKTRVQTDSTGDKESGATLPDPRKMNVVTTRRMQLDLSKEKSPPVCIEISYGPQGGRMATDLRKEMLLQSYLFECNCSACNDMYAETLRQKMFKCPKGGYACRAMTDSETTCPTCGAEVDMALRHKMTQLMARLLTESQDPSLTLPKRLTLLKALESTQAKTFVNTCVLYGNTCDQLAMVHAQYGDLGQSIEWCKKALKVVTVHFPHDSIEVAQETLKLAGLYFNNLQPKEAKVHIQNAIKLYQGHYGLESEHPDLMELYEMDRALQALQ